MLKVSIVQAGRWLRCQDPLCQGATLVQSAVVPYPFYFLGPQSRGTALVLFQQQDAPIRESVQQYRVLLAGVPSIN